MNKRDAITEVEIKKSILWSSGLERVHMKTANRMVKGNTQGPEGRR